MAQHRSAIKSHRQSLKKALRNKSVKSKIKTYSKKVADLIKANNLDDTMIAFREAESVIMKAVKKKVLKLNTAARKVSKLAHKVKALEKSNVLPA